MQWLKEQGQRKGAPPKEMYKSRCGDQGREGVWDGRVKGVDGFKGRGEKGSCIVCIQKKGGKKRKTKLQWSSREGFPHPL